MRGLMREETGVRKTSALQRVVNRLRGVLLPFTTPFGAGGDLDADALGANVERWNATGVAGYVALGSTGERVHLDERERMTVVEAARARVPRNLIFVVSVGEQSTLHTILESRRAADAGADAVLVLTPHFYRGAMTQDALAGHFEEVADSSPVPVILYNIPQNTGVALAPETVARLSQHANIVGIKDSSGDVVNLVEMIRLVGEGRDEFALMTGHAGVFYASLCAGVVGAILAAGCVAPRLSVEIYEAFTRGEHARALELQRRLAPLARAVTVRFGIGGLKYALDLAGYKGGPVRAPLREPNEEARAEIKRLLEETEVVATREA
jgi:dihydrodipicolinate synthase/N-acetylneuraminate lyase